MKKFLLILFLIKVFLNCQSQIIADHNIVEQFDRIPQYYLDEIKKMWLVVPGESHSQAYREGLALLKSSFPSFAVNVTESGTPEAYTNKHLRVSRATWGDINNASGWIYDYGEEDWCCFIDYPKYTYNPAAVERTKAGITYCNTNGLEIGAIGFAHCYDDGEQLAYSYLTATQAYIDYCAANGYNTKVFFTTGPVDDFMASEASGYEQYLKWTHIRDYVTSHPASVLFDYADILCYDDNGMLKTSTWNGHTYPVITDTNLGTAGIGHIGSAGAIRLAKAMWWMLARMSGWDGITTDLKKNETSEPIRVNVNNSSDEIRIYVNDSYLSGHVSLFDLQGLLIDNKVINDGFCVLNISAIPSGVYLVSVNKSNLTETKKVIIIK